ncbi:MAG: hypothetical protein PHV32_07395 [Eubacteriales bacterium]|nr:hypothetical protein [Eubacteriales bacterium]
MLTENYENIEVTKEEEMLKSTQGKKKLSIDKKHIQGFFVGILVSVIIFTGLFAAFNPEFLTGSTYNTSNKTVTDIDTVYYLNGDSTILRNADIATPNVKFMPASKQSGFEDIDIVVDGSIGDKYTLVFGVNRDADSTAKKTLVGAPKFNPSVEWVPLSSIKRVTSTENGDIYRSNERGVTVSVKKSGVKTFVNSVDSSQAAGVTIEFNNIGKIDIYSVFHISLTGTDGSIKTYKVLCHNMHLETEHRR